ncbi:MAG: RNA-binding cell elongation regulator Jag/EloR [Actinomycetota bacterium]
MNVTAKSLPEAIDLALDNLGVDEAEAEIEVLEEPKQGLFGRTRGNARVKARVKPRTTRPKMERGRNRRRKNEGGKTKGDSGGRNRSSKETNGQSAEKKNTQSSRKADGASAADAAPKNKAKGGRGGGEQQGGSRRGAKKPRQEETPVQEATFDEVAEHVSAFLQGLSTSFGFDSGVKIDSDDEGGLIGSIDGQHGLLVGPRGRTLDAVQELARVAAQRSAPSSVRIKIDIGGYRDVRRAALERFAATVADEARADGKERLLEPMSSADRKVIHDALNGEESIETRSAGSEPNRRVVVVPVGIDVADAAEPAEANGGGAVDDGIDDAPAETNGDAGSVESETVGD